MKKLITLTFILFFAVSYSFAQNDLTVTQTGDASIVDAITASGVTQDASAGGSNEAIVTQNTYLDKNGNPTGGHSAYIRQVSQAGDPNTIELTQSAGTNALGWAGAQTATLEQNGAGNSITGLQDSRSGRVANVFQDGNDNTSEFVNGNIDVDQLGDDNDAYSRGGGTVVQYQDGNRNEAKNFGNGAEQLQTGNDNFARSHSFVSGTSTYQLQDGDNNYSNFDNLRGGDSNSAYTEQYGNYNTVEAFWNQNGSNSLNVIQTSSYTGGINDGNTANVDFQSAGNTVNVIQNGLSNSVYSYQQ